MLGKLSWTVIPFGQPIPLIAAGVVLAVIIGVLLWVAVKGYIPYLWREWITSVDHKRIGVMYVLLAYVMLLRGGTDAIMMRTQQAVAFHSNGYLPPEHYDQIFSAHGTIMIFFVAMPFVIGLMNLIVPLQLGVRNVAFPTLNSVGFWLTATGALLVNMSLVVGEFARTGWLPVVATFSRKSLFGYRSMVLATMAICVISFMVWLHHFFTMGAGPEVNAVFGIASMVIAVPTGVKVYNWLLVFSIRDRELLRDTTGDPWDGRSLEWATSSPPPSFNFAIPPNVTGQDAYWAIKEHAKQQQLRVKEPRDYQDIEMPHNSPTGFVCALFATVMGFALIWHIWWMVALGAAGAFATFVVFAWRDHDEYVIPAAEVARIDRAIIEARRGLLTTAPAE